MNTPRRTQKNVRLGNYHGARDYLGPLPPGKIVPQLALPPYGSPETDVFVQQAKTTGLRLTMDGMAEFNRIFGADVKRAFAGERDDTISFVIQWPGYSTWVKRLPLDNNILPAGGVMETRKFVVNAISAVHTFKQEMAKVKQIQHCPEWDLSKVDLDWLILLEARQVGSAVWQLVLSLDKPQKPV